MKNVATALFYGFAKLVVSLVLLIWTRKQVVGLANVPRRGPVILASNHVNMLDPAIVPVLVPRRIVYMGKAELWKTPIIGSLYGLVGFIPVRRFKADLAALRKAEKALRQNQVLGMFPEGTRSDRPGMGKGQPGTAIIALRTGAPIVPVGIAGTEGVTLPGLFFRLTRVRVVFGKPFELPKGRRLNTELVEQCTERIMKEIAVLLPEKYRGVYAELAASQSKEQAECIGLN
ncbi:MAG: 1-acyl-sn-glycerol-3-phosphate acyltransferase [Dehalococcoidia bacterium]|nr:1-acyl-sn-glycerol-3-phosphate acyltransferase [Dehalococcoidia bacterium]